MRTPNCEWISQLWYPVCECETHKYAASFEISTGYHFRRYNGEITASENNHTRFADPATVWSKCVYLECECIDRSRVLKRDEPLATPSRSSTHQASSGQAIKTSCLRGGLLMSWRGELTDRQIAPAVKRNEREEKRDKERETLVADVLRSLARCQPFKNPETCFRLHCERFFFHRGWTLVHGTAFFVTEQEPKKGSPSQTR